MQKQTTSSNINSKSTNASCHLFFHVVRREKDFFKGVRELLKSHTNIILQDILLSNETYEIVNKTEYSKVYLYKAASELKILRRIINYKRIFVEFETMINNYIQSHPSNFNYYFYLADEGVWGEFINELRKKILRKYNINIRIVNIQHGFFTLEKPPLIKLRSIVNYVFKLLTGYPMLGKGFGGSLLDTYFVYGEYEKKYIQKRSPNSNVIVSPFLCKYELLEQVSVLQSEQLYNNENTSIKKNVLFAAQLNEIGHDNIYSEDEITKLLYPLFKTLHDNDYKIYYRLHPAIPDKDRYIHLLNKYKITQYITFANDFDLSYYLSKVSMVMALQSTVLFDGYFTGRMPVIIRGPIKYFTFTTPHEEINLSQNLNFEINKISKKLDYYFKDHVNFVVEKEVEDFFYSSNE